MPCKEYYDLKLLESSRLPIDELSKTIASKHLMQESRLWRKINVVTPALVDTYKRDGKEYIKKILEKPDEYGYLYFVSKYNSQWYNAPHFDYVQFPLMKDRECVLQQVKKMALSFAKENSIEFDATCLYLLYFFTLLVNPTLNWTTIDYLANGNRYHPYGTRLKGKMKITEKRTWV